MFWFKNQIKLSVINNPSTPKTSSTSQSQQPSLLYFDNSATTQKPTQVLTEEQLYLKTSNVNVHRSSHGLSKKSTDCYEESRKVMSNFIGCKNSVNIIFTSGATEGINLIANCWGGSEDRIISLLFFI